MDMSTPFLPDQSASSSKFSEKGSGDEVIFSFSETGTCFPHSQFNDQLESFDLWRIEPTIWDFLS